MEILGREKVYHGGGLIDVEKKFTSAWLMAKNAIMRWSTMPTLLPCSPLMKMA